MRDFKLGPFKKIGLFAKHSQSIADTFEKLIHFLEKQQLLLTVETQSASLLPHIPLKTAEREDIGKTSDLIIVLGGDGSLLNAARAIVSFEVPILGINRGSLGFLADILPQEMESDLSAILAGNYTHEERTLLHASIERNQKIIAESTALNDVVLYRTGVARMIEFEVYINKQFVLRQRGDGCMVATPTGSTAYALSGGGPILYPTLPAFVLLPMMPHTLTSRPMVIDNNNPIEIIIAENNDVPPRLSCDGQFHVDLEPGDILHIKKHKKALTLIHPPEHDYFSVLRQKLGWSTTQIKD